MKIRVWTAIIDGDDGEHHSRTYKTKEELISDLKIVRIDYEDEGSGLGSDKFYYTIHWSSEIFDTDGCEVVE